MPLFKKKPLAEQLDLESLRPDSKVVAEIDKKLSTIETNYRKYQTKLTEIAQQKAEIEQGISPADSSSSFDDVLKKLTDFFSFKKSAKTVEQLELEAAYLCEWHTASTVAGLKEVYPQLKTALTHAKETMEQLEQEYETAGNTSELDDLLPVVTGDLVSLLERFKAVLKTVKNGYGQSISIDSSETVKINGETVHVTFHFKDSIPVRKSLADKQLQAAAEATEEALHAKRMREFYSSGN
ncbi:hypothetical protein [Enterococcus mediterraneensis]|uniref:hypothetical protein n=1 Tax=Enterococcus mediterraneensis TaxID=2364791 RepID=UPI000F062DDB|nr:hypothetical protein [Enterococcus mediterraneensis]